jgi:hypothetical protein
MDLQQWAIENGSGSLLRAVHEGTCWRDMALHERLAMEVATNAILVPPSRITTGKFKADPDCSVTTELGWYARTLRYRWGLMEGFKEAKVESVYFHIDEEGETREGAGFIVKDLDLDWIPKGRVLLIPLAFWQKDKKKKKGQWKNQENPL